MQEPISLKNSPFPKMFGDLIHSNQFLKTFSVAALFVSMMTLGLLFGVAMKDPLVLTLGIDGESLRQQAMPKAEDQIREGVRAYLEKRYQWEPQNVARQLKESEAFIHISSMKAFQAAVVNVTRFSTEKLVTQKVYAEKIEINLEKRTALITGDRITSIQGLKAAGNLKLELSFESGTRTRSNPWGFYITKEREE